MSSYFVFMSCQRGFCRSRIEDSVICLSNFWHYNSALAVPGYVFMLRRMRSQCHSHWKHVVPSGVSNIFSGTEVQFVILGFRRLVISALFAATFCKLFQCLQWYWLLTATRQYTKSFFFFDSVVRLWNMWLDLSRASRILSHISSDFVSLSLVTYHLKWGCPVGVVVYPVGRALGRPFVIL